MWTESSSQLFFFYNRKNWDQLNMLNREEINNVCYIHIMECLGNKKHIFEEYLMYWKTFTTCYEVMNRKYR